MKTKTRKPRVLRKTQGHRTPPRPSNGRTRPPDAPLDPSAAESYNEVQPSPFKGDPRASIEDAVSDPDVEDSIGGE